MYYMSDYDTYIQSKYREIEEKEQRWESFQTEDAELVLVAYGISSRICAEAVALSRARGRRVGLIRPISLYPFPGKAFEPLPCVKAYLTVEMSKLAQMAEDVALASGMKHPIYTKTGGTALYDSAEVCGEIEAVLSGEAKEAF